MVENEQVFRDIPAQFIAAWLLLLTVRQWHLSLPPQARYMAPCIR